MTGRLRRIVIHIGCHKTGSTSIQDFAFEDKTNLRQAGVYYPGGLFHEFPRQHSRLYKLISTRDADAVDNLFSRIVADAAATAAQTVFLSGEDLCAADAKGVRLLSEVADKYFEEKQFIIVVRNPKDYVFSQFKHHLRYASVTTEIRFNKLKFTSGHRAIEIWSENFAANKKILVYDAIAENLLGNFYGEVFNLEVKDQRRSNASQDFLTLCIHNMFLKPWASPEIDRIHWEVALRHRTKMKFPVEELTAEDLSRNLDEDWRITGPARAEPSSAKGHDPIEVCDKMLTLFSLLREHFVKQRDAAAIEDAKKE